MSRQPSYCKMLDRLEMLKELKDGKLSKEIARARAEYMKGKTVSAEKLLRKYIARAK